MDSRTHKSALLNTSAKSDILRSGGKVSVTDLLAFTVDELLAADHLIHKAEVSQLLTLDVSGLTFAADTKYTVLVGNVRQEREAGQSFLRQYRYTSPSDITALTSEEIIDKLVTKINDAKDNFITAAKSSASVLTITDDAGYYPPRPSGRKGPSQFQAIDGLAANGGATLVITTAGVTEVGDGTRIRKDEPVKDGMTGNLVSGELDTPLGAVNGQFYSTFDVTYAKSVSHEAISGLKADKILRQRIFVDNGLGPVTTNLTGHADFLREFERLIYLKYKDDPNAIVSFIDTQPVHGGALGPPTGTAGDVNTVTFEDARLNRTVIGTQTIVAPAWTATGLDLVQDLVANDGAEYSAPIDTVCPQQYVVGQDAFSFRCALAVGDITDLNPFAVGLRVKAAFNADYTAYADFAAFAIDEVAGVTKNIDIDSNLAGAGRVTDDTLVNWADGEERVFEVQVDVNGLCTFLIDDVDVSSVQTPAYSFPAGTVVIPFLSQIGESGDSGLELRKWFSVGDVLKR